jgi:hypothetical protein
LILLRVRSTDYQIVTGLKLQNLAVVRGQFAIASGQPRFTALQQFPQVFLSGL